MAESTHWRRDILIIPVVVGLVVALGTFLIPKWFEKGKRLSYSIEGPTPYVHSDAADRVRIFIETNEVRNAFGYKARIWNSGGGHIGQLAIRFSFDTTNSDFRILSVRHSTKPKQEFGKIEESGSDSFSKRFVYELLNQNDEDLVTFMTSVDVPLSVFAKAENLKVEHVQPSEFPTKQALIVGAGLIAVASSLVSALLKLGLREELLKLLGKAVKDTVARFF